VTKTQSEKSSFRQWTLVALGCWTVVTILYGGFNYWLIDKSLHNRAHTKAHEAFNKDQSYRLWATMHGGVYVPVTQETPPNEYLKHVDDRDISTPGGKRLTLMNPAYMVRQMNDTYGPLYGVRGHITSLKPIRPGNEADEWETKALRLFEKGQEELYEVIEEPEGRYARLMKPMYVSAGCLKCHAQQGYKVGDVRGGVSVKVPLEAFVQSYHDQIILSGVLTSLVWLGGVGMILIGASLIARNMRERDAIAEDLKRAKIAAESSNRSKSEFLANMSHEIRTPLNGLMGLLQLVRTTPLNSEQADHIGMAMQSSRRLSRLLSDILDLSRVEADKLTMILEPFELRAVFDEVRDVFLPVSLNSHVTLECRVDEAVPEIMMGDAARLQQVLVNLVGNGFKFTESGKITLEASLIKANGNSRILLSVSDTGIGISDDKLDALFEPFTQGTQGYTKDFQGAGLGLAICKRLVGLMHGSITVESEVGRGTTFYLSIPFGVADSLPPTKEHAKDSCPESLHVLLAEDDKVNQIFAQRMLEQLGHEVEAVPDGSQAIEALKNGRFDLVCMDIQMPVMDGVEATRTIRRGDAGEGNKTIPIVALTAYAMESDRKVFLDAGMDDYLAKPLELEDFKEMLLQLNRRRCAG